MLPVTGSSSSQILPNLTHLGHGLTSPQHVCAFLHEAQARFAYFFRFWPRACERFCRVDETAVDAVDDGSLTV